MEPSHGYDVVVIRFFLCLQAFKNSAFRLETNRWKKGEEIVESDRRTFTFLADSKEIAEHWLYRIRLGQRLRRVLRLRIRS